MIDSKYFNLSELKFDDDSDLIKSKYISFKEDMVRIYYKPNKSNGNGFEFYCLEIIGGKLSCKFEDESTILFPIFTGEAYFDGVRHLYFGRTKDEDFNGYIHCPNLEVISQALQKIKKLEKLYCSEL